eukprot:TRINITY_DN41960_c0_g1_i1.p1 TRINITY_DN41960_c0_g1~~TRINITY_DN41960_c0_g1_i1.p1  ORF type:complete len:341 (+),score=73.90 TRINITY_DN41960_c0_g1_i1:190-1212(+)
MAFFADLLGAELLSGKASVDTRSAIEGKVAVGLYFSAHWCPPCRAFTPKMAKSYAEQLREKGLEIVFISKDDDEQSFAEYYSTMPWLALPSAQSRSLYEKLEKQFEVESIPTLVLLNQDGSVINCKANCMVELDPKGEKFPAWAAGKGGVPRGMTRQLAEQNTTLAKFMMSRHIVGKMAILQLATPAAELVIGSLLAMRRECHILLLVWWLLFDGIWGLLYYGLDYFTDRRGLEMAANTDLQAYLIRKDRDGTTNPEWEAKAALMTPPKYMSIFSTGDLISSAVGCYLYASTAYGSCSNDPLKAILCMVLLKIATFCVQSVAVLAVVAEAQNASSEPSLL